MTTVFVTHDQDEALSMSDRIAVMSSGRVHQVGTPEDIYHRPADRFVADFVGSANILDGVVASDTSGDLVLRLGGDAGPMVRSSAARQQPDARVTVIIRPEAVAIAPVAVSPAGSDEGPDWFAGRVTRSTFLGDHYVYLVDIAGTVLRVQSSRRLDHENVRLSVQPEAVRLLVDADNTAEEVPREFSI